MASADPPAHGDAAAGPAKGYKFGLLDLGAINRKLRVRKTLNLSDNITVTVGLNHDLKTRETVPVGEVSLKVEDLGRLSFNDKRAQISKSFGWDLLGGADITLGLGIGYTDGAPNIKFDYLPRPNVLKAIAGGLALRTGQRIHAAPSVKLLSGGPVEAAVEMDLAVLRRGVSEGRGANGALILDLCAINGLIYLD